MCDLAFTRGILSGVAWATHLLRPLSMQPRPTCPYPIWRPLKRFCWRLGLMYGVHQTLHRQ